jgi:hypothetical protein
MGHACRSFIENPGVWIDGQAAARRLLQVCRKLAFSGGRRTRTCHANPTLAIVMAPWRHHATARCPDEMRHFVRDDKPGGYMSKTVLALALACAGCALIAPDVMARDGGQATHGRIAIRLGKVSDSLGPF